MQSCYHSLSTSKYLCFHRRSRHGLEPSSISPAPCPNVSHTNISFAWRQIIPEITFLSKSWQIKFRPPHRVSLITSNGWKSGHSGQKWTEWCRRNHFLLLCISNRFRFEPIRVSIYSLLFFIFFGLLISLYLSISSPLALIHSLIFIKWNTFLFFCFHFFLMEDEDLWLTIKCDIFKSESIPRSSSIDHRSFHLPPAKGFLWKAAKTEAWNLELYGDWRDWLADWIEEEPWTGVNK